MAYVIYVLKRCALLLLVILGVVTLTFFVSHVLPADPARLSGGIRARPEQVEALRAKLNLDKPILTQYWLYLRGLSRGDLGTSVRTEQPVSRDLLTYFPATLELTFSAVMLAMCVGIPLGVLSATSRRRFFDFGVRTFSVGAVSIPSFWLGLMLQLVFYMNLNLLPCQGRLSPFVAPPSHTTGLYVLDSVLAWNGAALVNSLQHLVLPTLALGAGSLAVMTRMTRSSVLEVLRTDYVQTAWAKGLSKQAVLLKHVLRNALLAISTVIGLQIGALLAGSIPIEVVFSWPGVGSYAAKAITFVDFNAILGVTIISAVAYAVLNLMIDLLYLSIDPRIRYV